MRFSFVVKNASKRILGSNTDPSILYIDHDLLL